MFAWPGCERRVSCPPLPAATAHRSAKTYVTYIMIKLEVIEAFQKQIDKEREASVLYEALANWCAVSDYNGFAKFYVKQAAEEREHARKFVQHLLDRQVSPKLGPLAAPPCHFENLVEVAEATLAHEQANTRGVLETYEVAKAANDYAALILLDWFVKEQVEEEVWSSRMVTLTKRLNSAQGLYDLDHNIEKDLEG
jgi:ferritin